ncbi:hypothetical protein [Streptomyces antimicrobicus]|uniref:Uncharacterized protein n=1 Tax=Streptomyces antimicrobicus TaxID=2883108 RepID=A0ABS8B4Y0_9ACTN|nr:hypothetical protein [Streptomyces antimicrobicus]MCB5179662.1 hypothetical protein [Streptomyces antimicrobicus]
MRIAQFALRATGAAVALTAASALAAPTALANPDGNRGTVSVSPSTARPGEEVELRVHGCEGRKGWAKSAVFVADAHLSGRDGPGSPLFGEAKISSRAEPGWHTIRVLCDHQDDKATGSIQIVRHGGHHHGDHQGDHHGDHQRPHHPGHATPFWPSHAGGGGMAAELAAAPAKKQSADEGPGLPHTVIGAVLAAVATLAVAGKALAMRRRRSGE